MPPKGWRKPGSVCDQTRHNRVVAVLGKADTYTCDCGQPAKEWAQVHGTDGSDPGHFAAMCKSCHRRYDRNSYVESNGNALKTHCLHNHEFTFENTLHQQDGRRICRTCKRDKARARRAKAKQDA